MCGIQPVYFTLLDGHWFGVAGIPILVPFAKASINTFAVSFQVISYNLPLFKEPMSGQRFHLIFETTPRSYGKRPTR